MEVKVENKTQGVGGGAHGSQPALRPVCRLHWTLGLCHREGGRKLLAGAGLCLAQPSQAEAGTLQPTGQAPGPQAPRALSTLLTQHGS